MCNRKQPVLRLWEWGVLATFENGAKCEESNEK